MGSCLPRRISRATSDKGSEGRWKAGCASLCFSLRFSRSYVYVSCFVGDYETGLLIFIREREKEIRLVPPLSFSLSLSLFLSLSLSLSLFSSYFSKVEFRDGEGDRF